MPGDVLTCNKENEKKCCCQKPQPTSQLRRHPFFTGAIIKKLIFLTALLTFLLGMFKIYNREVN